MCCNIVNQFVKSHQCLCIATFGLAIVAYLGYRLVAHIAKACGTTAKVKHVAQEVLEKIPETTPKAETSTDTTLKDNDKEKTAQLAKKILDEIFMQFTSKKDKRPKADKFKFTIINTGRKNTFSAPDPLIVKYGNKQFVPLADILEALPWHNLDSCWQGITDAQLDIFFKKSYLLESIKPKDKAALVEASANGGKFHLLEDKEKKHLFLAYYMRRGFMQMNGFLRTSESMYHGEELVDKVARELIFSCACAAGTIQLLPKHSDKTLLTRKIVLLPSKVKEIFPQGQVITERAFVSSNLPGGEYEEAGAQSEEVVVNISIKPAENSRGKNVQGFRSKEGERECLFPPFTQFKVKTVSGFDVELVEIEKSN
jgi:hypothetical protein